MCAMHKVIFYISISVGKLMISVSVWFIGRCVGLGCGLGFENEKNSGVRLSPTFFSGHSCSRTVSLLWCLTSNQKVLICTTHFKKVVAKLYSFILRSKISEQQYWVSISQRSEISLVTGTQGSRCMTGALPPALSLRAQRW